MVLKLPNDNANSIQTLPMIILLGITLNCIKGFHSNNLFQVMMMPFRMRATSKVSDKICLKVIRDTSCPICGPRSAERQGNSIFWWEIFGKFCAFYQNSRITAPDTQYTLPPNYSPSKGLIYISLWNWALQKIC